MIVLILRGNVPSDREQSEMLPVSSNDQNQHHHIKLIFPASSLLPWKLCVFGQDRQLLLATCWPSTPQAQDI